VYQSPLFRFSTVKVTVRFCPLPPHTPPSLEAQALKIAPTGKLSVKVTEVDALGPLLVKLIVYFNGLLVRHPRQSRWLDEWCRLKGDHPVELVFDIRAA